MTKECQMNNLFIQKDLFIKKIDADITLTLNVTVAIK